MATFNLIGRILQALFGETRCYWPQRNVNILVQFSVHLLRWILKKLFSEEKNINCVTNSI